MRAALIVRLVVKIAIRVPFAVLITTVISSVAKHNAASLEMSADDAWFSVTLPVVLYLLWGWMSCDQKN